MLGPATVQKKSRLGVHIITHKIPSIGFTLEVRFFFDFYGPFSANFELSIQKFVVDSTPLDQLY